MKKVVYMLACSAILLGACEQNNNNSQKGPGTPVTEAKKGTPTIAFEEMEHNFGNVVEGEKVEYSFKFTNTGDASLVISDATSSCGCTVPDWPREPIHPGKSSYIKVMFNSAGKSGFTAKQIILHANTSPELVQGPKIICTVVKQ
jgi:hypothetical protein